MILFLFVLFENWLPTYKQFDLLTLLAVISVILKIFSLGRTVSMNKHLSGNMIEYSGLPLELVGVLTQHGSCQNKIFIHGSLSNSTFLKVTKKLLTFKRYKRLALLNSQIHEKNV